jgi:hypothetical protein
MMKEALMSEKFIKDKNSVEIEFESLWLNHFCVAVRILNTDPHGLNGYTQIYYALMAKAACGNAVTCCHIKFSFCHPERSRRMNRSIDPCGSSPRSSLFAACCLSFVPIAIGTAQDDS